MKRVGCLVGLVLAACLAGCSTSGKVTTLLGAPLAANSDSCVQGTPTQVSTVSSSAGHPEVLVVGYCHGGHWYIGELAG